MDCGKEQVKKELYQGKKVDFIPNILPVSDLRNYNEVLKNCQVGDPFLKKWQIKLLMKLQEAEEAEEAVKDENSCKPSVSGTFLYALTDM